MPKKDKELILKGEQLLKNMIRITHRHIGTNIDDWISASINIEVSRDQHRFILNTRVEDLNTRDPALAAVGKGTKKKITNMKLDTFGLIKDWSDISNRKDMIKRLKGHPELADALAEASSMDQSQRSNKNVN